MALTNRQHRFALAIIDGKSNTEAYQLAGYSTDGMSEGALAVEASRLRHHNGVNRLIEHATDRATDKAVWSRKKALERLETVNTRCLKAIEGEKYDLRAVRGFMDTLRELNDLANVHGEVLADREERFSASPQDKGGIDETLANWDM